MNFAPYPNTRNGRKLFVYFLLDVFRVRMTKCHLSSEVAKLCGKRMGRCEHCGPLSDHLFGTPPSEPYLPEVRQSPLHGGRAFQLLYRRFRQFDFVIVQGIRLLPCSFPRKRLGRHFPQRGLFFSADPLRHRA